MPCTTTSRTETLRNARDFVRHWDVIQSLRQELDAEDDVLLNPLHFLAATDNSRRSCSVACWQGERFIGLVYATEHHVQGFRTGYAIGGDFVGRGLLLCRPQHEAEVLRLAIETLGKSGVHALHLRMVPSHPAPRSYKGYDFNFDVRALDASVPGDRMELAATFDGWLATLGKHTRRNVRYYTRKAVAEGIEFVPELTPVQYQAAIARLNNQTSFRAQPLRLNRDERFLALHGGGLRFGLRAADGSIVAVVSGFTHNDRFHLLTQLNDVRLEDLSLSLVLRGFVIQYLIEAGHKGLQFMGGASLVFSRFCEQQPYRSLFIDKNAGLSAAFKFVLSRCVGLLDGLRLTTPDLMKSLANGRLAQSNLIARTVLAPAAIVSNAAALKGVPTPPDQTRIPALTALVSAAPVKPFPPQLVPSANPSTVWSRQQAFARTSLLDRTSS